MSCSAALITLQQLPSFDHCVHPDRPVRDVFDLLETDHRIPGVMVYDNGRFVTAMSRPKLLDLMRRRFSHELFWDKPVRELVTQWTVEPFILPARTSVTEAINKALTRQGDALTEPVVCQLDAGRHSLVDMHALLAAQCAQLAEANQGLAEANRASELASKAKTDFLANMSHEIRTPMTAILGYAELLQDPTIDDAQREAAVRTIRRSGEHLLNLLNDILDVSKIEAGRLELERLDHDPASLLREIIELMSPRASVKNVKLVLTVEPQVPALVHTDPTRLRQIVSNLIGNAIKFTSRGEVRVTVRITAGSDGAGPLLCVTVADTGIGIPPASLTNLFQPFVQADATMSRRFGGSGLGLTISRTLARMLGGDIVASSEPGKGSTFTATVSAGIAHVAPSLSSGPVVPQTTGAGAPLRGRILLAEDGPDNQRLFTHHLARAGATVDVVPNGEQAVARATGAAQDSAFDLILMDMQMPGTDGYEATRRLRSMGYVGPIVALTAHAMAADRDRALAAGCDDYLTKPISRDTLIRACQKWLNAPRQRRAA